MASGLSRIQTSISKNLIPCLKGSTFNSGHLNTGWRNVVNIALNSPIVDDTFPVEKNSKEIKKSLSLLTLKEKEKGDWRNLTFQEKQALYRMSFSQPFCHLVDNPADEWKIILASTFTAMGMMTLGMYIWISQGERAEAITGPISLQNELKTPEDMSMFGSTKVN